MRAALLLASLFAAAGSAGCGSKGGTSPPAGDAPAPTPSPKGIPDSWTHRELADHLGQRGLAVEVEAKPLLSREGVTAAVLLEPGEKFGGVVVYACRDHAAAREQAGSMGKDAFSSGRFAFGPLGNEKGAALLARVRPLLP